MLAEAGAPSYKFDLDTWNPEYFARLNAFVDYSDKKNMDVIKYQKEYIKKLQPN